jgi:peroxidase
MKDGVMGEFGGSLVGEGFRRIRDGDRFWYEIALPKKIVKEIENTTFGDVIARNTGIKNLPENVFKIEKKPTPI